MFKNKVYIRIFSIWIVTLFGPISGRTQGIVSVAKSRSNAFQDRSNRGFDKINLNKSATHRSTSNHIGYPLETPKRTIFTGKVPNSLKSVTIRIIDESTLYFNRRTDVPAKEIKVTNGSFSLELDLRNPVYLSPSFINMASLSSSAPYNGAFAGIFFSSGIPIEPGDSIWVDGSKSINPFMTEVEYSGLGAEKLWCMQSITINSKMFNCPKEDRFLIDFKLVDSIDNMVINTVDLYENKISAVASSMIKAYFSSILYYDIASIIMGTMRHNSFPGLDIHDSKTKSLFAERDKKNRQIINANDSGLIYSVYIYNFIEIEKALLRYKIENGLEADVRLKKESEFDALLQYIPNGPLKERVLVFYVAMLFKSEGITKRSETIAKKLFSQLNADQHFYKELERVYHFYKANLAEGSASFDFNLPDTCGITHKMSDFKGKVILMDFMFTGCTPCKRMVPYLKEVKDHFKNHAGEIVYLSITIDRNIKRQLKIANMVGPYFVPGSLYLHTNGLGSSHPIVRYYNVSSFPTLVLIGKDGKIVSSNAPNPKIDNGKMLISLIERALK